jgi:hypothetical protein
MPKKTAPKSTAPKRRATRAPAPERHWDARIRSGPFRKALAALAARELKDLARQRVGEVVDARFVRTMIRELDTRVIDRAIAADLVIEANRRARARLTGAQRSLLDLLDRRFVADIGATLEAAMELPAGGEAFAAALMRQEFVRNLFTDIIYTAIVSFNERVNPLFGAFATRALEDQIKGFIDRFMPMLQAQAVAFAVERRNQRIVLAFARSVVRLLLEVPVARYAAIAASADGQPAEAVIRTAVTNARLGALVREATLALWDDFYAAVRARRLGDLLRLDAHADWLAARAVEIILPLLARPHVRRFIAAEIALAQSTGRRPGGS